MMANPAKSARKKWGKRLDHPVAKTAKKGSPPCPPSHALVCFSGNYRLLLEGLGPRLSIRMFINPSPALAPRNKPRLGDACHGPLGYPICGQRSLFAIGDRDRFDVGSRRSSCNSQGANQAARRAARAGERV